MRRYILILLVTSFLFSHTIELYDGSIVESDFLILKGDSIYLKDKVLFKNDVKSIIYEAGEVKYEASERSDITKILELRNELENLYSEYKGVIIYDDGYFELFPDGERVYRYHFAGLVLKDERREWANFIRYFQEDAERFKVLLARVIKRNGEIIEVDKSKIKISKPRQDMEFFGKGKVVTFTFPNVEIGDIVEYIYEDYEFNPWNKDFFEVSWFFGGDDPVYYSNVKVKLPEGKNLYFTLKNVKDVKIDSTYDKGKIYTFEHYNAIPIIEEPGMPAKEEILPRLVSGIYKDWDYIMGWYSDFQKNRMIVTKKIKALTDSIIRSARNDDEKIGILYHWVQRNIRYISIKGSASSSVSGHKAEETLKNGYGDCTDKAILFSTMLKAVGIEAYPVYLHTNDGPDLVPEIPTFWGNHAIVEVFPKDREPFFLDPVSTYNRYPSFSSMDHGVHSICAMKNAIHFINVPPPEMNHRNYNYEIYLNRELSGIVNFLSNYEGDFEAAIRGYWDYLKGEEIEMSFLNMVKSVSPDAELLHYKIFNLNDISQPFKLRIIYKMNDLIEKTGDILLLRLPEIKQRYSFREIMLEKRNFPLMYQTSEMITHRFYIELPEDVKILSVPDEIKIDTGKLKYNGKYRIKDNTIIFEDCFKRYDRKIETSEYKEYRDNLINIKNFISKPVIIERR